MTLKHNLKTLYKQCQLAFASNDDKIMADELDAFKEELEQLKHDGWFLVPIDDVLYGQRKRETSKFTFAPQTKKD